jgi:ABC-2 type transport system ATP-binding protein
MSAVVTSSLTKRFGGFVAVEAVDLTVEAGEVVGVLGANGAGKSTLMRMILGLLAPSAGKVLLFGEAPSRDTRRRTGYVPQGLGLYRDLTAAENLEFVASIFGMEPHPAPDGTGAVLLGRLPLGLQRQAAFTSALQHRPGLLVLDEPTSGVGPLTRARLWDRIRDQAVAGTAVLVSTHYMDEARQADRLVLMARGRVVASGKEQDIVGGTRSVIVHSQRRGDVFTVLEGTGVPAALAGGDVRVPGADPAHICSILAQADLSAQIESAPASLEEVMVLAGTAP